MNCSESNDRAILCQIGQKLRRARLNANIGQDELAKLTGLSRKTIQNAEAGNNYSMETLIRVLRGLNSLDYLDAILAVLPLHQDSLESRDTQANSKQQERQRASS